MAKKQFVPPAVQQAYMPPQAQQPSYNAQTPVQQYAHPQVMASNQVAAQQQAFRAPIPQQQQQQQFTPPTVKVCYIHISP